MPWRLLSAPVALRGFARPLASGTQGPMRPAPPHQEWSPEGAPLPAAFPLLGSEALGQEASHGRVAVASHPHMATCPRLARCTGGRTHGSPLPRRATPPANPIHGTTPLAHPVHAGTQPQLAGLRPFTRESTSNKNTAPYSLSLIFEFLFRGENCVSF